MTNKFKDCPSPEEWDNWYTGRFLAKIEKRLLETERKFIEEEKQDQALALKNKPNLKIIHSIKDLIG